MSIKRWDLERIDYEEFEMVENESGSYVEWEDHLEVIKKLVEEINKISYDPCDRRTS